MISSVPRPAAHAAVPDTLLRFLGALAITLAVLTSGKAAILVAGRPAATPLPPPRAALSPAPDRPAPRLSAAEWGQIGTLMTAAEYQATPQARADGQAAFWAPNRVNDLSIAFGPDGLSVRPWQQEGNWSLSLRAAAYGPAGATAALPGAPLLSAERQLVTYRWPGVREWYSNSADGLKHNVTIETPVAAEQLQVDLALGGTLRPQVSPGGQVLSFVDAHGASVLDFGALYVYDAAGATLAARFGSPQDGGATLPILVETRGARYPITIDPLLTSPRPKITAGTLQSGAQFGFAVAADGEVLVVGSFAEDGFRTPNKGAAYVFTRNRGGADAWGQVRKLLPGDVRTDDNFGASVAVSGDVIIVGAPRHDAVASNDGAAYIFERHLGGPDNWGLKKKLVPSRPDAGDEFGFAVAASSDAIAVGAVSDDTRALNAGAVYLFHRYAGLEQSWGEAQQITISASQADDAFGFAVAMDHNTLVVGAPRRDARGADSGEVWVFKRHRSSANQWQQERCCMLGSDTGAGDNFGRAVAIDGDTIIAGAPLHDVSGAVDRGAAYTFARNQGGLEQWGQTKKLLMSSGAAGDRFGESVAIDGRVAVVGAPRDDDDARGLADAGSLTIYVDGLQLVKLLAADRQANDRFGFGVTISGDLVVGGAPFGDAGALDSGAAFLFTLNSELWSEARKYTLGNMTGITLDDDTLAFGVFKEVDNTRGIVYILQRNKSGTNSWVIQQTLVNPEGANGTNNMFGSSLALEGDLLVVGSQSLLSFGAGHVYVYQRNRGGAEQWGMARKLEPQLASPHFGIGVAISGDTVAVGAGIGERVEVFERNQGGRDMWGRTALLSAGDAGLAPRAGEHFGTYVALDGNTLAVGSRPKDALTSARPSAFIYERAPDGVNWIVRASMSPSRVGVLGLDLDDDTLAIIQSDTGFIELFNRHEGGANNWGLARQIPQPTLTARFASPLALDGDLLAYGGSSAEGNLRSGRVFLYERNIGGANNWGFLAAASGSSILTSVSTAEVVALDGNTLASGVSDSAYVFTNPVRAPTGLGLQTTTNVVQAGEALTVTAAVSGEAGAPEGEAVALGVPQGEITFYLNGEPVGAAQLDGQGRATLALPGLPQGAHQLVARFAGNDNWAACESPPLDLFVGVEPPPPPPAPATLYLPLVQR